MAPRTCSPLLTHGLQGSWEEGPEALRHPEEEEEGWDHHPLSPTFKPPVPPVSGELGPEPTVSRRVTRQEVSWCRVVSSASAWHTWSSAKDQQVLQLSSHCAHTTPFTNKPPPESTRSGCGPGSSPLHSEPEGHLHPLPRTPQSARGRGRVPMPGHPCRGRALAALEGKGCCTQRGARTTEPQQREPTGAKGAAEDAV